MGVIQWAAVTRSIVGDLHIKKGLPNQDAIGFYKLAGSSHAFVMAVSDGHGSEKCPRSDIGSALAVNTAVKVFIDSWSLIKSRLNNLEIADRQSALVSIERHIRKDITKQLVENWVNAVEAHAALLPFESDQDIRQRLLAYGATLTIVFLCEYFSVCLRLGDSDVLIVGSDSTVIRIASGSSDKVGEDTDSLCMPNADKRFSVLFDGFSDAFALNKKLFLICSDGYEKAFKSNEGFEQSAIDFANLVSSDKGCEIIEREIESWLREYSKYSGDDVSVGILFAKPESLDSQTPETASERPDLSYEPLVLGESLRKDYLSETDSQLAECDLNYPPEIQDE